MSSPLLNETGPPIPGLIGSSEPMERIYRLTRKVAREVETLADEVARRVLARITPAHTGEAATT